MSSVDQCECEKRHRVLLKSGHAPTLGLQEEVEDKVCNGICLSNCLPCMDWQCCAWDKLDL